MNRIHLTILVIGLFIFSVNVQTGTTGFQNDSASATDENPAFNSVPAYTPHSAIVINNNSDFMNQGWSGAGIEEDPFLIENLNITANTDCITISDTDAFFKISLCYLGAIVDGNGVGIWFTNVTNGQVANCEIINKAISLYVETSTNCQFEKITTDSKYGNIYIGNSDNCRLLDSVILEARVSFSESQNCIIRNVTFYGGGVQVDIYGYYLNVTDVFVNDKPLGYFYNQENQSINGLDFGQIILVKCSNFSVHDGNFSNTATGLTAILSSNCTIENSIVSNNLFNGIFTNQCDNFTIRNNTLKHNGAGGISVAHLFDSIISDNVVERCYDGIWLVYSNNIVVNGNFVTRCTDEALEPHGTHLNVTNNIARDSDVGIHFPDSDYCYIIGNEASGNTDVGIEISSGSQFNTAYGNIMFSNGQNADDDGMSNTWDDSNSFGNLWGDFIGGENYSIPGSANSVDRFPQSADVYVEPPTINQPVDIYYELGTLSYYLMWSPSDYNPTYFMILIDGLEIEAGVWHGGNISIDVGSQAVGVFNYTIIVFDSLGNSVSDSVSVIVEDTTAPSLNQPPDLEYLFGETGNQILWTPFDLAPASYSILWNGTVIDSSDWAGPPILLGVDDLSEGIYNYTLIVSDESNNSASDTVIVTVSIESVPITNTEPADTTGTPTMSPEPTETPDSSIRLENLALVTVSFSLVVILIVITRKRDGGPSEI